MKLTVTIYTLNLQGSSIRVGELYWDGGKIVTRPVSKEREVMLRNVMTEPIMRPGEDLIDPKKEPENFMRNLWRMYRSPYLQAMKAV